MSLTTTEEALVRQLLDQQVAILSLAGNESTITSKLGATKVNLSDLVAASAVSDTDLLLTRQGTTDKSVTPLLLKNYALAGSVTPKNVQDGDYNTANAGGTADALTGDYTPNIAAIENGLTLYVRAGSANATTAPTFSPDGLTAKAIVKGAGAALAVGDIAGAGHWLELNFDSALDKWVLLNPAFGVNAQPVNGRLIRVTWLTIAGSGTWNRPSDTVSVRIRASGAGAGQGAGIIAASAGGYAEKFISAAASSYAWVVGAGGVGNSSGTNAAGGATTIAGITCNGGQTNQYGGTSTGGDVNVPGNGSFSDSARSGAAGVLGGAGAQGGGPNGAVGYFGSGGGQGTDTGGSGGDGWICIEEFS